MYTKVTSGSSNISSGAATRIVVVIGCVNPK